MRGADLRARGYFWALRNVSFSVHRGESFGIVGVNGAGKSTLLRLIGRVGAPEEGTITVNGRLVGLLELAAGFFCRAVRPRERDHQRRRRRPHPS